MPVSFTPDSLAHQPGAKAIIASAKELIPEGSPVRLLVTETFRSEPVHIRLLFKDVRGPATMMPNHWLYHPGHEPEIHRMLANLFALVPDLR